jgi:hypothetical protein
LLPNPSGCSLEFTISMWSACSPFCRILCAKSNFCRRPADQTPVAAGLAPCPAGSQNLHGLSPPQAALGEAQGVAADATPVAHGNHPGSRCSQRFSRSSAAQPQWASRRCVLKASSAIRSWSGARAADQPGMR